MLQKVDIGARALEDYASAVGDAAVNECRALARPLLGARVLHVSATPYGGGVSELLRSIVPIERSLGLVVDWGIIAGDDRFFGITKRLHNGLQGAAIPFSDADRDHYVEVTRANASRLDHDYDVIVVHDPQPAGLLSAHGRGEARWIWRCHIDTGAPHPEAWRFLRAFLAGYDAAVFTMPAFIPGDLPVARRAIIPPAIDPLSPKNMDVDETLVSRVLDWIGIASSAPLVTQVSRFDPWKDPMGVIEAYRRVRKEVPGLQLALVGSMALDDPQGWEVYRQIDAARQSDPLLHVFTNLTGVGNIEVNAFQRRSAVVIQKSIREGFGLVISEALWKGTPVVAGRAGGIPLQMDDTGGFLVDGIEECADRVVELLRNYDLARQLGAGGRERVRRHFLLPRLIADELRLLAAVRGSRPVEVGPWEREAALEPRDPVCGMPVQLAPGVPATEHGGRRHAFCSERCRQQFARRPGAAASA